MNLNRPSHVVVVDSGGCDCGYAPSLENACGSDCGYGYDYGCGCVVSQQEARVCPAWAGSPVSEAVDILLF